MQINSYNYNGQDFWRIDVNPQIQDYERFDFPGGAYAAIGMDAATQSYKIAYLLYPQSIWSQEELENNEQIQKLMAKCNVCSVLNQIKDSTGGVSASVKTSLTQPKVTQSAPPYSWTPEPTAQPQVQAVRPSAGDVVQPKYLPVIANLGKSVFCTTLGGMTISTLMSLLTDLMAGWATDEGHRKAFQDMSDEFIAGANICPADTGKLKEDIKRLYDAYKKDGVMPALKVGMIKDVAATLKENGIDVKADVAVKTRTHVGLGKRSLVD